MFNLDKGVLRMKQIALERKYWEFMNQGSPR